MVNYIRMILFFSLIVMYFESFVLSYMLLETAEFALAGTMSYQLFSFQFKIDLIVYLLFIMIFMSVLCFVILVRSFSMYGKNMFKTIY